MIDPTSEAWAPVVRALARELARELAPDLESLLSGRRADPDTRAEEFLSVLETCKKYGFSRGTFDRMLADPASGLQDVVVRLPPVTGRVKVPTQAFEAWLRAPARSRPKRAPESRRGRAKDRLDSSRTSSVHAPAEATGDGR